MPYAEWYINSLRIPGSPVQKYHHENYGNSHSYYDFAPEFKRISAKWSPDCWGDLFQEAGARYIVFITKHMDGFLMWPSSIPNYRISGYQSERDIVGELAASMKARNIKLGLYYSSLLDQSYTSKPMIDIPGLYSEGGPIDRRYSEYQYSHWVELIDRYQPSVLWGDIGYPPGTNPLSLFAYFYNKIAEGVVNDRWAQNPLIVHRIVRAPLVRPFINWYAAHVVAKGEGRQPLPPHYDFTTPEYATSQQMSDKKWEANRGMANSFSYNRMETEADYITLPALIRLLVDTVSKNGNLMIDVGPMADGTIPEIQVKLLRGLGAWVKLYGEAIYGTRTWQRAEGELRNGGGVRFTQKGNILYVFLMDGQETGEIVIKGLAAMADCSARDIASGQSIQSRLEGDDLALDLPKTTMSTPVRVLALTGK
jgi:alpha-L-fucosidase